MAEAEKGGPLESVSSFLRGTVAYLNPIPGFSPFAAGLTTLAGGVDFVGDVLEGNGFQAGRRAVVTAAESAAVMLPLADIATLASQVTGMETLDVRKWAREWAGSAYDNLTGNFNTAASGEAPAAADPTLEQEIAPTSAPALKPA